MNWPTPYPMRATIELGDTGASRMDLPRVPLEGGAPPPFSAPGPIEKRADITGVAEAGSAWPGAWTLLPDEGHDASRFICPGATSTNYPWGRFDHTEKLTYDVDDAHPAVASVLGESEYVQVVGAHTLTWRGHLAVRSDAQHFDYNYVRELMRDGTLVRSKSWH